MFEKFYRFIQMKLACILISLLQSSFMKYIIHTYKYRTHTLYIGEYSANEFNNTWKILCMKKCPNGKYYYTIDPTTPLKTITTDVVYTLQNSSGYIRYFPVFAKEVTDIIENTGKDDITLYTVLRWRINNQISDYNPINKMYHNLFDSDDQYFIPYMEDNMYIDSLDHMYKIGAIY